MDGIFMTYENNCEEAPLACYPVQNLDGEYYYTGEENLGGHLNWDTPTITNNLDHFNVYRTLISYKAEGELIAEIPYDGLSTYEYFDNMASQWMGGYKYEVTCTYARGDENCESEEEEIIIIITDLAENSGDIQVYPNPTNGLLNIEGQGTMLISISNLLGQTLQETKAEGNTTLDMSRFESGMYLIRIETENGVTIQKVNLR